MTTAKNVILTAIHFQGIENVEKNTKELSEKCLCSESYVKAIIRKVYNNEIQINSRKI
jgi:hypothetical protein